MIFELLHAPYPEGYGEALLPLEQCKAHLRVTGDDEDDLIAALRDAALEFVEQYCSVRLRSTAGIQWRGEGLPHRHAATLMLGLSPVTAITGVSWLDREGATVVGSPADLRLGLHGDVLPAIGGRWPSGIAGGLSITFTAGYGDGEAPPSLLAAARMFLGHLWLHREAVIDSGTTAEVPFGVAQICAPFRRVLI